VRALNGRDATAVHLPFLPFLTWRSTSVSLSLVDASFVDALFRMP
jgi:hypothetical protein